MSEKKAIRTQRPKGQLLAQQHGLLTRLILLSSAVLLVGQIAISWIALDGFEDTLEPQLKIKANAVGYVVSAQISYAVNDLEIPAAELVGMAAYFSNILESNPDIEYLAYLDSDQNVLYSEGIETDTLQRILDGIKQSGQATENYSAEIEGLLDGAFPLFQGGVESSFLHVGVSGAHVRNQLSEILFEVITVIAISWLVTLEFLNLLTSTRVSQPLEHLRRALADGYHGVFSNQMVLRTRDEVGRLVSSFNRLTQNLQLRYSDFSFDVQELKDSQIDAKIAQKIEDVRESVDKKFRFKDGVDLRTRHATQIRVPLFLFVFAEEMTRSFLPLYVSQYAPVDHAISFEILIGLPITLFMLAAMVATPFGGGAVDRFGTRAVFLMGICAAVLGFIGNFFSQTFIELAAWRILTGIGYGLVFIASESWVTTNAKEHTRATSTSVFVSAVYVGFICGPALGGIIADRIGFEATFLICAIIAVFSGYMVYVILQDSEINRTARSRSRMVLGFRQWLILLKDVRFVSVLLFSAVPGKMMLTGFMAYLVPLFLNDLGHSQSSIGRLMMLYGLSTIVCVTIAAKYADRSGRYSLIIVIGTVLSAIGFLASFYADGLGGSSNVVVIGILTLGFGHALTLTSQNSIIQQVAANYRDTIGTASVISSYRLVERIGMVTGPLVAVVLIKYFGYQHAIAAFGCMLLALISLFFVIVVIPEKGIQSRQEADAINA